MNLGDIVAALMLDISDFTENLAKAHKGLHKFVHLAEEVTDSIVSLATGTIKAGFEMGQAMEEAEISIANMTGSVEKAASFMEELRAFAVATPFEFKGLTDTVRQMQATGIEIGKVLPLLEIFGDQVASAGAGTDALKRIVIAFTQMSNSGKVMTQEMNQFTNAGVRAWDVLAKSIGVSVGEARNKVKTGFVDSHKFLQALLADMIQRTHGQMKLMSQTLGGMVTALKEQAGFALADAFKPWRESIKALIPEIAALVTDIGRFFSPLLILAVRLTDAFTGFLHVFNAMPNSVKNTVYALTSLVVVGALLVSGLTAAVFIASAFVSAMITIGGVLSGISIPMLMMLAGGITVIIAGLTNLAVIITTIAYLWKENWNGMQDNLIAFWNGLKKFISWLGGVLDSFFTGLLKAALTVSDFVTGNLIPAFLNLAQVLDDLPGVNVDGSNIRAIAAVVQDMRDNATAMWKLLESNGSVGGILGSLADDTFTSVKEILSTVGPTLKDAGMAFIKGPIRDMFESFLPETARQAFNDWLAGKINTTGELEKEWSDFLSTLFGDDVAATAHQKLVKFTIDEANEFNKTMRDFWDAMKFVETELKPAVDTFVMSFKKSMDKLADDMSRQLANTVGVDILGKSFLEGSSAGDYLEAGQTGALAAAFGGLSAGIGALVAIIAKLITETETFQFFMDNFDGKIESINSVLDAIMEPLRGAEQVFDGLFDSLIALARDSTPLVQAMQLTLEPIRLLAAAIRPFVMLIEQLGAAFDSMSFMLDIIGETMNYSFMVLFYAFKFIALVIVSFAYLLATVWNGVLDILIAAAEAFAKIPGLTSLFSDLASDLENSKADIDALDQTWNDLIDLTWEDALATTELVDAKEDEIAATQAMVEELINVPEGFKVALARWATADIGRSMMKVPQMASGGIVTKPTFALIGEAGPEAVIPLSKASSTGGGGVYIEHLELHVENMDDFVRQLEAIKQKQAFVTTGATRPRAPGTKYSTK